MTTPARLRTARLAWRGLRAARRGDRPVDARRPGGRSPARRPRGAPRVGARRRGLAAVLALVLATGIGAGTAWAWWTSSDTVGTSATAGVVAPPTGISCTTQGGLLNRSALVAWTAASPAPAHYRVTITAPDSTTTTTTTTGTSIAITQGLLGSLLDSILQLLLGGAVLQVSVQAVHASGWVSTPTASVGVRNPGITIPPQAGVICA